MTYELNAEKTVAVDQTYFWRSIGPDTPRGVKLQLLGRGGVAVYGMYTGCNSFWIAWAPLPKVPPDLLNEVFK